MPNHETPGFIAIFDGGDGVGKSKQIKLAASTLRENGYTVETTRASGGTPYAEALRDVSLNAKLKRPPEADLHTMLACHATTGAVARLHREAGKIVLADRGWASIIAYQGEGSGLDRSEALDGAERSHRYFDPDLTIIYKASLETWKKGEGYVLEPQVLPTTLSSKSQTFTPVR